MFIFILFIILGFLYAVYIKPHLDGLNQSVSQNNQHGSDFTAFFPLIDLFSYYAQCDNRSWTPDKVKYIKHILEDFTVTDWDRTLLKERLKLKNSYSLNHLIEEFKRKNGGSRDKCFAASTCICEMLYLDNVSIKAIKEKVNYLGGNLGLTESDLSNIYRNILQDDNSSNQEGKRVNHNQSLEWACSILDLQLDQVSPDKIQQAYRAKINEYHPDKHQTLSDSIKRLLHEKTQDLNKAKAILLENS